MTGLLVGVALALVGAALVGTAWLGSQQKLRPTDAFAAAAGPLGVGGGVIATCAVGVLASGLDEIGVALSVIALAALVVSVGVAGIAVVSRDRGPGRR
jgi:hypothetical protein